MAKTDKNVEPIKLTLQEYHFPGNDGRPATVIHATSYDEALRVYRGEQSTASANPSPAEGVE